MHVCVYVSVCVCDSQQWHEGERFMRRVDSRIRAVKAVLQAHALGWAKDRPTP